MQAGSGVLSWFTVRFFLLARIAAGHCTLSCSLTVKVNLGVSRITCRMGFPPPLWCVCTKWSVRVVYTDNGNARRTKEHQALALNVWYWPSLTALITCWQYKQFRTQLWLDRQDGVNEPYYTDYLTSVQWVMWSYFTLACLKHTLRVSPGMFAFQLQPRITSPQLRPDKA